MRSDDFMAKGVGDSMLWAEQAIILGSNKACFSAPFFIKKGSQIYPQWFVNTVISTNNELVITSYLSDDDFSPGC